MCPSSIQDKQILIVEEDNTLRNQLRRALELEGYEVAESDNGRTAQNRISTEEFCALITNIQLPEVNGIELMHFTNRTQPMPIIFLSEFAENGDREELLELGAAAVLQKPFQKEELYEILKNLLGSHPSEHFGETKDIFFCKVSIDDFISGREMKYDIYIRLSSMKFVKIAHQGDNLPLERLKKLKGKEVQFLYMRKEDFGKYIEFNLSLAPLVRTSSKINKEKKMNFIKTTGELVLEEIYMNGVNEATFDSARAIVDSAVSLITEQEDLFKMMELLDAHTDFLYAHSLGVSMYGAMIARALRWTSAVNIYKISIGGLFHDIGKKEIDRDILKKTRQDLTIEEINLLETHPLRGMQILQQVKGVPQDVLQIVMQHHENCLGMGYPVGLRRNNIHPMARLISVTNEFCNYAIKNPNSPQGMKPHDAIQKIISLHADQFDPNVLLALMELFNFPVPDAFYRGRNRTRYDEEATASEPEEEQT